VEVLWTIPAKTEYQKGQAFGYQEKEVYRLLLQKFICLQSIGAFLD
jgi:hypothetical protein